MNGSPRQALGPLLLFPICVSYFSDLVDSIILSFLYLDIGTLC